MRKTYQEIAPKKVTRRSDRLTFDKEDDEDDDDRHIRTPSSHNKGGRNRNGGKTQHGLVAEARAMTIALSVRNRRKTFPQHPSEGRQGPGPFQRGWARRGAGQR